VNAARGVRDGHRRARGRGTDRDQHKQRSDFSGSKDWIFASPIKLGRLPYSYTGVWRELERAAEVAKIGHLGTHSFLHTHRSWLDAVGTSVAVQQRNNPLFGSSVVENVESVDW
jgi:integrase